jgi:toxin YoeB
VNLDKIVFSFAAYDDYIHWQATDPRIAERIHRLIVETRRDPFRGIGKPEPLKYQKLWSRRVTAEHRLLYRVVGDELHIVAVRGRYDD